MGEEACNNCTFFSSPSVSGKVQQSHAPSHIPLPGCCGTGHAKHLPGFLGVCGAACPITTVLYFAREVSVPLLLLPWKLIADKAHQVLTWWEGEAEDKRKPPGYMELCVKARGSIYFELYK